MTVEAKCVLWQKTRVLAQDRGFEMDARCPMDTVCTGEVCIYLAHPEPQHKEIKRFYKKLEKHNARKRK